MLRIPKVCAKALILLLLFSGMVAMAGVSWLKSGPRTLPGMDSNLSRIIAKQGWPFSVSFSGVRSIWEQWDSPLSLEFRELKITSQSGDYQLEVPKAVVRFRIMPLLQGRLKFREISLHRPYFRVELPEAGTKPKPAPAESQTLADRFAAALHDPAYLSAIEAIYTIMEKPQQMPVRRIYAYAPVIELVSPEEQRRIERERITFSFRRGNEGPELQLKMTDRRRAIPNDLDITLMQDEKGQLLAKATMENASTEMLADFSPDLGWHSRLGLFFTGEVNGLITRSGQLEKADFGLFATHRSTLPFALTGSFRNQPSFQNRTNVPDVALQLQIDRVGVERLAAYWPYDLGVNARSWVTQNLLSGEIHDAVVQVKLPPDFWVQGKLPVDGLRAEVPFKALDMRFAPDLPLLKAAEGTVEFTRDTMRVTLDKGQMRESKLQPGATAFIPNLGGEAVELLDIEGGIEGPVGDLLHFYAIEQKKQGKKPAFAVEKVTGLASSRFTVHFPLLQELKIADIVYTVKSEIRDMSAPAIAEGIDLDSGQLQLNYNKEKVMEVKGTAAINGALANLHYTTRPYQEASSQSELQLTTSVDALNLGKFGFPEIPGLTGPIGFNYNLKRMGESSTSLIRLDGREALLQQPAIGLTKPAGSPLDVALELEGSGGRVPTLTRFSVEGPQISAKGTSRFNADGKFEEVFIQNVRYDGNDGQLKITPGPDGRYDLQVVAESLNLAPLIQYYNEQKPEPTKPEEEKTAFFLKGTGKRVQMANGEVYTQVAGELSCNKKMCTRASLQAKIGDNQNLSLSLIPGATESVLNVQAENAGAVLRGLDIYRDIRGGVLTSRATASAGQKDAPYTGNLIIKDFRVVGTPVLARLLTLGSLTGIENTLRGKGINFTKLDGRYTYGNGTYQFNEFKLYGSSIGLLLNGFANLNTSQLKLSGTLIPAYGINNAIGQVPIVGNLLGKGVFATSFTVEGSVADPKTQVYPLSTLAPGILSDFMRDLGILPKEKVKQPPQPAAPAPTPPAPALPSPSLPAASEKKASAGN